MAKIHGGLFSFGASGAIGKVLTYSKWRGIDYVKAYVVPANPRSAGQVTQRGYMFDAITEWHRLVYLAGDRAAYSRLALIQENPMSGYNVFVRLYLDARVTPLLWLAIYGEVTSAVGVAGFTVTVNTSAPGDTLIVHWGTTPTNLAYSNALSDDGGGVYHYSIGGLATHTIYFFRVTGVTGATHIGSTGIFRQMTA